MSTKAPALLTARQKLALIKTMVCGDRAPNWSDEWSVGDTRGRIADLCEDPPLPSIAAPSTGLTDRQIKSAFQQYGTGRLDGFTAAVRALAAIPVAMAEVRTLAAAEQQPVAYRVKLAAPESGMQHAYAESERLLSYMQAPVEPLYAAPLLENLIDAERYGEKT